MSTEHARPGGSAAGQPGDLPSDPVAVPPQEEPQATEPQERRTRISATWVGILVAIVVLVLLLIFILENLRDVNVTYLGASGQLPLGVALLFAAIGGALMVAMAGVARLTQLRLHARQRRHARAPTTGASRTTDRPVPRAVSKEQPLRSTFRPTG